MTGKRKQLEDKLYICSSDGRCVRISHSSQVPRLSRNSRFSKAPATLGPVGATRSLPYLESMALRAFEWRKSGVAGSHKSTVRMLPIGVAESPERDSGFRSHRRSPCGRDGKRGADAAPRRGEQERRRRWRGGEEGGAAASTVAERENDLERAA